MQFRLPHLRGVIKWPPITTTAVIATSGLVIVLAAVSRHVWRGGGKKAIDPDRSSSEESPENIDKEKRSDRQEPSGPAKGKEILEEKEEPLKKTVLTKATIENKVDVLTGKPNLLYEVTGETDKIVTSNIEHIVLTESSQSQLESTKSTDLKVTLNKNYNIVEEENQVKGTEGEEFNTKVKTRNISIVFSGNSEPRLKVEQGTKQDVITQETSILLEEKPFAQNKVTDGISIAEYVIQEGPFQPLGNTGNCSYLKNNDKPREEVKLCDQTKLLSPPKVIVPTSTLDHNIIAYIDDISLAQTLGNLLEAPLNPSNPDQHKVTASVEAEVTKVICFDEKQGKANTVCETETKVRPLYKEIEVRVENPKHPRNSIIKDDTPKYDADQSPKPVSQVNQELTQRENLTEDSASVTKQHFTSLANASELPSRANRPKDQIIFVERNCVNNWPSYDASAVEKLKQEETSQSVETKDSGSELEGSGDSRIEVVKLCDQTGLILQSKSVPEKTPGLDHFADIAIISDGKSLETELEPSNHLTGSERELESVSFSSPRRRNKEQSVESVKVEGVKLDPVNPIQLKSSVICGAGGILLTSNSAVGVEDNVKRVNSVISDSVELEIHLESSTSNKISRNPPYRCVAVDSAHNGLKDSSVSLKTIDCSVNVVNPVDTKLEKPLNPKSCEPNYTDSIGNQVNDSCASSLKSSDHPVQIVNSVIVGVGKVQINPSEPLNEFENDDNQLGGASITEKSIDVVNLLEIQYGELQHIPLNSSGYLDHFDESLQDISVSSIRTEKSVTISPEEKSRESTQVCVSGDLPENSGEGAHEVGVPPLEKELSDIVEAREEDKAEQREKESLCRENTASEVTLVSVVGDAELSTLEEKVTESCIADGGSSALGDQVEVVTVQHSYVSGVGLTDAEVEVCPADKGSKILEKNGNKPDGTLPSIGEEGELIDGEILSPLGTGDMLTKGAAATSDLVKGNGGGGKRKGKKGKKMLDEEELEKMVKKMEVKDIVTESEVSILQNGDVGEDPNGKSSQVDASGISSPSIPNFPDNRSESSSCGDSGKGRSDVTTPGGLEEDLREVSFTHHFSPPCSTSGPEEEEEVEDEEGRVRRDSGSTAEDGSRGEIGSAIEGEEVIEEPSVEVGSDRLVMTVPVPVCHGLLPVMQAPSVYEFVLPQGLVGRLIGKQGSFVNLIKERTSAAILIKTHPETNRLKVCAIEGTDEEIHGALDMIREKFPLDKYSSMTLEQVFFLPLPPPTVTLIPDALPLQLVEGVSNDVILSALVSPSHYFLQQPTHPTYPTLAKLDMWMAMCYQDANAPMLPEDAKAGVICAAPTMGGWYRAEIVAVEELLSTPEDETAEEGELIKWCDVRFVDYGGYQRLPSHSLRQIRSDFMTLPFQASECYLASVVPTPESDANMLTGGWSMEAYALVEELTQAQVLKAQVVGHATDGVPLVLLYAFSHSYGQVVQVNNELVNRGLAVWAVPIAAETDQVLLANGSDNFTGNENPPEDQPKMAIA